MRFDPPLEPAIFLRRYSRFLADVKLTTGETVTVHCPNTGSMKNCLLANSPCWLSRSNNPKRKYAYTWEIATTPALDRACINTARANAIVKEALLANAIKELMGYKKTLCEVKYGSEGSRIDFVLADHNERAEKCYIEVKSVTLADDTKDAKGRGLFPDAVSQRASKHLRELIEVARQGERAVLFYCVQHTGIDWVEPADAIDPIYGKTLREARAAGVETLAYRTRICADEMALQGPVEVRM